MVNPTDIQLVRAEEDGLLLLMQYVRSSENCIPGLSCRAHDILNVHYDAENSKLYGVILGNFGATEVQRNQFQGILKQINKKG
jgi:hypothetical protein